MKSYNNIPSQHPDCQYVINPIETDDLRKCGKLARVVIPGTVTVMDRHFCFKHAYILIRGILKAEHDRTGPE